MADSVEKINLKFGLYPYIPDLGNDKLEGLKDFIKKEFESEHPDITLTVSSMWKPYKLEKVVDCFKTESFDILEMDTLLLGEMVDEGVVQELDLSKLGLHQDDFLDSCMDAVTYKETCYGVPTLSCAQFLLELVAGDGDETEVLCSLETGDKSFKNLPEVVEHHRHVFKGTSEHVGDSRGKWTFPMMYLDAYTAVNGSKSFLEGAQAPINVADDSEVLKHMKCTWSNDASEEDDSESDHVMKYGYSELLGQFMADKMREGKKIHASCIMAPPLGADDNLLTYTDAIVFNKESFSDGKRAEAITKFMKFYTSLSFRNKFAAGTDLKEPHPPRYVMISRKDFYTEGFGASDKNYKNLHPTLLSSVAVPNHGFYAKVPEMNRVLEEKLGFPPLS